MRDGEIMKTKVEFRKPKWLRRIASALLDFICACILALFFSYLANPISNAMFNGKDVLQTYYEYALSTNLYEYDTDGSLKLIDDITIYDQKLTYFYDHCTENNIQEYENFKKEEPALFTLDTNTNKYVEIPHDLSDNELNYKYGVFYDTVRDHCIVTYLDKYLYSLEGYKDTLMLMNKILYMTILLSLTFASLIVYLLIPLLNKDGKTLGKMAFKLRIVSSIGNSSRPSKGQIVFRQLFTIFFEYVLSIATLGFIGIPLPITLLVSMSMLFLTKYNQSFHDLCCSTFLVDDYPSSMPMNEGDKYVVIYNVMEVK